MNSPAPPINCTLAQHKKGSSSYTKMSYPVHCGIYSELSTRDFVFHFNLNNEIIRAKRKGDDWGHPHEWLKRTIGNDWVYYSTGGYTGVFEATGEYYLPNFRYPTNSILGGHPFRLKEVKDLSDNWHFILQNIEDSISFSSYQDSTTGRQRSFLKTAIENSPETLEKRAQRLFDIIGGRISVLPPDARHVDYNLIPLTISRGCLYKCRFCKVKNNLPFTELSRADINSQLEKLRLLFDKDLPNYNSLYLGEHDALLANHRLLLHSVEQGIDTLELQNSNVRGNNTFLFGSVGSLLGAPTELFQQLEQLPGKVYINIGLESADQETLDHIGKPIKARDVVEAFHRSQEINRTFASIEITANFIMDGDLPTGHYPRILELIRDSLVHKKPKGTIYFSPLTFDQPSRARLFEFNKIKIVSRLPTHLYIIQRL